MSHFKTNRLRFFFFFFGPSPEPHVKYNQWTPVDHTHPNLSNLGMFDLLVEGCQSEPNRRLLRSISESGPDT